MAEALFRREAGARFAVASSGLTPLPVDLLTVGVFREVEIDVSGYEPRAVAEFLGRRSFRFVVSVCKAAEDACPTMWPFALEFLSCPFENPAALDGTPEERLAAFRAVRDGIHHKVGEWAAEFSKVVPFPSSRARGETA
jgi:arsenate reductase